MAYRVLIVDDSSFFQTRLKGIINECPDLEVVGIAANGQEAIEKDESLRPDVISMDYEMPFVDGITAVRAILTRRSVPIVMFSSMTYEGARITLEALDAGAVDFIPKNFADVSNNSALLKKKLHEKLVTFARNAKPKSFASPPAAVASGRVAPAPTPKSTERISARTAPSVTSTQTAPRPVQTNEAIPARARPNTPLRSLKGRVKLLAIGASTGGPVAVTEIISKLPADFPVPVIVIQHMPENFTRAFSERLDRQSALSVKEAENGDLIQKGHVLVAPGNKQLMIDKGGKTVKIIAGDDRVNYKPCIDITYASAAQAHGDGVLAVILTGMGADGCEGARLLKQRGSSVWSQDQETCVVYGMPAAVAKAELTDAVFAISEFADKLQRAL